MTGQGLARQPSLFPGEAPGCDPTLRDLRRTDLGAGAWIDHLPGWVTGHEAVLEALWTTMRWQAQRRQMYDRTVDVPRLVATWPDDGSGHPLLSEMHATLSAYYARPLPRVSLAAYRDGRDSVAFHGDRLGPARGLGGRVRDERVRKRQERAQCQQRPQGRRTTFRPPPGRAHEDNGDQGPEY